MMQEKVKERMLNLARQSRATEASGVFCFTEQELLDFARKISRECGGIYDCIDNGNAYNGTDNYLLALKKHFE